MVKKLYFFGNGLGKSIDSNFYSLDRALKEVWENVDIKPEISNKDKSLIRACLDIEDVLEKTDSDTPDHPQGEKELQTLQDIVTACDKIKSVQDKVQQDESWLTNAGTEFPNLVRRYMHAVSGQFLGNSNAQSEISKFLKPLIDQIYGGTLQGSHIVTTNYDDLIYDTVAEKELIEYNLGSRARYCLRDGFKGQGKPVFCGNFDRNALNEGESGDYLHIHGSPLYLTASDGSIKKIKRSEINKHLGQNSLHIVLSHIEHKEAIIQNSEVLSTYWSRFRRRLDEVDEIVILGSSGEDRHVNDLIASRPQKKTIRIIERPKDEDREKYWYDKLGGNAHNIAIKCVDTLTNFKNW